MDELLTIQEEIRRLTIFGFSQGWANDTDNRFIFRFQELCRDYEWEVVYDWTLERKVKQYGRRCEVLPGDHAYFHMLPITNKKGQQEYHKKSEWFASDIFGNIKGTARITIENLRKRETPTSTPYLKG